MAFFQPVKRNTHRNRDFVNGTLLNRVMINSLFSEKSAWIGGSNREIRWPEVSALRTYFTKIFSVFYACVQYIRHWSSKG